MQWNFQASWKQGNDTYARTSCQYRNRNTLIPQPISNSPHVATVGLLVQFNFLKLGLTTCGCVFLSPEDCFITIFNDALC